MEYWLGITGKFVVCFVFLCAGTDISATIQPIVVKFCVVRVPDLSSPLLEAISRGASKYKVRKGTFVVSKTLILAT